MRILGFVLSAAVLHVVVLVFTPDNNSQIGDEFLVGVALVQRQIDPLAATGFADVPSAEQEEILPENFTAHSPAVQTDKFNIVERQGDINESIVQELPVEVNHSIPEPEEQLPLPEVAEEVPAQPVHPPRQPLSSLKSVTDTPDKTSPLPSEQANPPAVDHHVIAETLPKLKRSPVEQKALISTNPQAVDGVQTAKEPLAAQVAAQPRYGYNPAPAYPGIARRRGWDGTVEFNVRVLTNGEVGELTLKNSSGYKSLDDAARRAITRWRFTPASRAGRVVESWVVVPVHFVLDVQMRSR